MRSASGVGTRRPSKTQPRNCYCSQARWAKEFHRSQLKRAKQFKLHRNQILNMIWYRVASLTVQRWKVNCFVLFLQLGGWTIYYFYIQTNCTVLWNVGWIYNGAGKTLYVCYSFCRARVWYGRCGFNTSPRGPFPIQHILDESNQLWWNTQKKGQISFLGERWIFAIFFDLLTGGVWWMNWMTIAKLS